MGGAIETQVYIDREMCFISLTITSLLFLCIRGYACALVEQLEHYPTHTIIAV